MLKCIWTRKTDSKTKALICYKIMKENLNLHNLLPKEFIMSKFSSIFKDTLGGQATSALLLALGSPEAAALANLACGIENMKRLNELQPMPKELKIASYAGLAVGTVANYALSRKFKTVRIATYIGGVACAGLLAASCTPKGKEICEMMDQAVEAMRVEPEETVPAQ